MNRIDRLLGILTFLQSRKYTPAEKIAEKFDISIRTVYRDIKALGEQGIPVSFEQQRGYHILADYFLPPVSFNNEEANALLLMETLVYGFTDKSIQQHYSSALQKVKAVLKTKEKERLEALTENMRLQLPSCFKFDFSYLSQIQQAISEKKILRI
jgi:predicted DNA-binding transcriptional regulator YafY